jgi:predicted nuclease with TOPRIM domain
MNNDQKKQRLKEIQAELAELRREAGPLACRMFDIDKRVDELVAEMLRLNPMAKEDHDER